MGRAYKNGQECFTHAGVSVSGPSDTQQALLSSDGVSVRNSELKIRTSTENAEPSKCKSAASEQGLAPRRTHLDKGDWSRKKEKCKTLALVWLPALPSLPCPLWQEGRDGGKVAEAIRGLGCTSHRCLLCTASLLPSDLAGLACAHRKAS